MCTCAEIFLIVDLEVWILGHNICIIVTAAVMMAVCFHSSPHHLSLPWAATMGCLWSRSTWSLRKHLGLIVFSHFLRWDRPRETSVLKSRIAKAHREPCCHFLGQNLNWTEVTLPIGWKHPTFTELTDTESLDVMTAGHTRSFQYISVLTLRLPHGWWRSYVEKSLSMSDLKIWTPLSSKYKHLNTGTMPHPDHHLHAWCTV